MFAAGSFGCGRDAMRMLDKSVHVGWYRYAAKLPLAFFYGVSRTCLVLNAQQLIFAEDEECNRTGVVSFKKPRLEK